MDASVSALIISEYKDMRSYITFVHKHLYVYLS